MNDNDLKSKDIQTLSSKEGIASFFATIGYDTETRLPQTATALGITAASLQRQIKDIEQLAVQDDGAEPLYVYLVELTSVTIAATQSLARAFRNRMGNYLLVLTNDYERIDFVLLERILPQLSSSNFSQSQVSVMPRTLTVNRRNPSKVDLRVLRRFTCTEADSDAQYDKLLSAYTIAEWSEPLFNNRALFSDYYLSERLPDLQEWQDRPEMIYRRFRALFTDFRANLAADIQTTKQNFLEPAFNALGFQAIPADDSSEERADYSLFTPTNSDNPIAVCLAYNWNRYLDGRDETRDTNSPEENPGARVVTVLESGEAPWAIVTNGKLWRLYSARTHSRATNYYEIDLEETLAIDDPREAFRYFYLFFRAAAFVPEEQIRDGQPQQICFLDKLLEESETYAKGLGDRLKERVFDQVFPHFAEGFIEHLKRQPGIADPQQKMLFPVVQQLSLKQEPNETFRRLVFEGTLILLYRLLFLLYAEARGLLPVREQRGYYEHSLTRLKEDIAEKAGKIYDEAPTNLDTAYRTDTTDLYDRLMKLFATIDRGSRELNVPLYNGGLFITEPQPEDSSSEAETAHFLQKNKIPDRYLAKGLDLLTRDLDDKRQDLVFIDYKSLGVRQLGSIYEGLLEFKIRIASEKMAVVKGKRTEEVIPYKEAKKVLTIGRGRNAQERVYQPGEVYLENDRRERKATGSYYTPEHIVKYIVENTVGPVLEKKFEKLRSKFRQAQARYHKKLQQAEVLKKQGLRPDDPNKVANTYQSLVDELFDLRVLDPAMGSGHFLVEAVDFICDRILGEREGFLRAFPWNPVTTFLDNTRQAIIAEMERQRVSVDASRLTDINLLKRHVLKRCVYGVDLTPMAVELAKVSLWLDCFTIGAPLSFLDHHLKCGNALIGTTVQEVQTELANQADLFGGPFQGLLAATATIEELRRIPDATAAEVENSRNLFADFEKSQAPYKIALNIWLSRHFGNKLAAEYLTLSGSDLVEQIRPEGRSTPPSKYRETINKAIEIGKEKGFFHWDLEFPEAFVDLKGNKWKRKEDQGFDAVVGNPPYDVLGREIVNKNDSKMELAFYAKIPLYTPALIGSKNIYKLFICRGIATTCKSGILSFIVPMSLLGDQQATEIRRLFLEKMSLIAIEVFPQKDNPNKRVFYEAKLSTTIFIVCNKRNNRQFSVRTHPANYIVENTQDALHVTSRQVHRMDSQFLSIKSCTRHDLEIIEQLFESQVTRMGKEVQLVEGEVHSNSQREFLSNNKHVGPLVLRGASVSLYALREASQGESLYLNVDEYLKKKSVNSKAYHHRRKRVGFQRSAPQNNFRRLIAAPIPPGNFCFESIKYVTTEATKIDLNLFLALMNSQILDWYFRLSSTNASINEYQFNQLPIPSVSKGKIDIDWRPLLDAGNWTDLSSLLSSACNESGIMPKDVGEAIAEMCRRIQEIEARRVLKSRSERSRLAPESQPIQDAIDRVLYRCYGLSDDDAQYIENRLKEML